VAQLRVALAQINPVVGDLEGNADQVLRWARDAADRGAHLVAFPEMALTGYPVEDLALRRSFVDASRQTLDTLAARLATEGLGELVVVVGYLDGAPDAVPVLGTPKGAPQNAAAVVHRGRVAARYAKHHLPNYGVFDEYRYFVPGRSLTVARVHGADVAIAICEDIWQEGGPVAGAREAGAGLLLVINGSPYERNKDDVRLDLAVRRAAGAGCALAYVNMVGGQDELVFDGDSLVVAADGTLLARAAQFETELLLVDLDLPDARSEEGLSAEVERVVLSADPLPAWEPEMAPVADRLGDEAEVYAALVTGLRDYVGKNGFEEVVLGLSGGIDSALTAALAVEALGAERVHCVSMPSRYSSEETRSDARQLAENLGTDFRELPIGAVVDAFDSSLAESFAGREPDLTEENLQARIRGVLLMALSNKFGWLVVATGNKSELSVGYATLYGDMAGGFALLKDVFKTDVFRLARHLNERAGRELIPATIIERAPSAELRADQLDEDSLPPYPALDRVLEAYVEQDRSREELSEDGFEPDVVERALALIDRAEYKRRQAPPGVRLTPKAFGRDRRTPITNHWRG
jgi:NAD+ synthase (glutamine-hydrolysing)